MSHRDFLRCEKSKRKILTATEKRQKAKNFFEKFIYKVNKLALINIECLLLLLLLLLIMVAENATKFYLVGSEGQRAEHNKNSRVSVSRVTSLVDESMVF